MKTFRDYLEESEYLAENPAVGDVFELEIAREEIMLESYVVDVVEDGVVIEADETMMRILMHVGYLTENSSMFTANDSISPINGGNDARRFNKQRSEDDDLEEAKYQGREVPLGKKMAGDVKKSKVYVRGPKGNVVKVNFGDPNMKIKKSNPKRRKSFRARHNCDNPGPRWKARYWSCRSW
jgi:hypothetical protein